MTTGRFKDQLRRLNPRLRVCAFDGSDKLAGLYYIDKQGEYFDICGVDKGHVPEYSEWDSAGHMVRSGWRRVFLILMQLGLTTARQVQAVCPGFFLHWSQSAVDRDRRVQIDGDPIAKKLSRFQEKETLSADDILDVATDIRAKSPQHVQEQDAKERWFLREWARRGGNTTDKPRI
jgi:hypothetical protein